eukprot:5757205-Pleurochrysis_carterae.AAC.1
MPATRLCLDGIGTRNEIVTRSRGEPIVDVRSDYSCRFDDVVLYSFLTTNLHVCTRTECPRETEPLRTRQRTR